MSRKKKIIIYILAVLVSFISAVSMYFIIEVNKPPVEIPDTDAQFETTLKEAPKDGSLPTEHSATDVIAYTLYNVANTKEFKVITRGTSDAFIATIQIANERVVKNGSAMISTVSDGIVSFGTQRFYFPQEENKVLVRDAKKISNATATWNTNKDPECVTYKEMRKRYGWFPFQANGYIICDDTYLNKDDIVVKDNNDGTYKINFSLDPDSEKAPFWYRREIVTSSGSTIIPRFSKIEITFIIDKNYRLLEQQIKENYTVKTMGIEADTKTNVVDTFSYDNVEFDQESYNWFMQYRGLEAAGDSLDDGIKIKEDDIETMLVSSLQNDAKEDVNLDLSLNYKNINLNGKLALNINDLDNISFKLKLGNYITLELNNNIIYLNINDNKFKSSLSSLNLDLGSLDLNSILASLNEGTITGNDNNILIDTNLEILNIKLNLKFDIDKIEDKYNLNSITVKTNILGDDLVINASRSNTGIDSIIGDNYKDLDLNPIISNIRNIINNKELNLYLEFSINNINVIASGDISFKDDLYANLNINFKMDKLEIPLILVYSNDIAYIKYENIKLSINKEVLNSLFKLLTDKELNIESLISLINDKTFNLDDFISKINNINIESNDNILFDLEYDNIALNLKVNEKDVTCEFDNSNYIDLTNFINNLIKKLDKDSIKLIIEDVKKIIDIAKRKEFNIDLDLTLDKENNKYLDIIGNIQFYIYENGRFDLEIKAEIFEYKDNSLKMIHSIDLKLISKEYFIKNGIDTYNEDYIFATYGTNPDEPSNLIKMYSPAKDLLSVIGTLTKLLGVDLSFLNNYSTFNFNDIDVTQIKNLFKNNDSLNNINLDSLINDINVNMKDINLNLNLSELLKNNNTRTLIKLSLEEDDSKDALISINDLYIKDNLVMNLNELSLIKNNVNIIMPNVDSSYYDISSIDELVSALLVTASSKSYEISGEVTLKAIGFIDALSIPFTVKVKVYDDGSFTLYAHLEYDKALLVGALVSGKETSYYYSDGYVIIDTKYTSWFTTKRETIKVTASEFLGNLKYYVFDFGMRFSDTILNMMDSGNNTNNTIDASKVLTGYSSSGNDYNISLNIGELTGISGMGDLDVTVSLSEIFYNNELHVDALTSISSLSLDMFTLLNIELNDPIKLTNIKKIDNELQFVDVNMDEYINYIDSYQYEVGKIISY